MLRKILEYALVRSLIGVILVLPIETCHGLAEKLAYLFCDIIKFRSKVIDENIRLVYPNFSMEQRQDMSRKMWFHLIMMGIDIIHAPRRIHQTNWRKYVYIRDIEQMTNYLIDYRPLIAVTGHFGNFEIAGYVTGLLGMPSYSVARKLDNELLDRFINSFRELNGQFIIPKDGSAGQIQEVLDSGAILTILGDQHAGNKGCWIDFLGRPASCHKAIALFSLGSGAPMMVSYCRHLEQPLHFEIGCTGIADPMHTEDELKDVKKLTQWYNDRMADAIRSDPDQYWWVHRRWKEKPVRKRKPKLPPNAQKSAA
ncbi:MAG: lysophospholipid acyltransferase family protein [Planctomycetota bacterium]